MLERVINALTAGVDVNGYSIYAQRIVKGRFREEQNMELHYGNRVQGSYLLYAKVFHGRPPEYSPWLELFNINQTLCVDGLEVSYFDSQFEDRILQIFSENLGPGTKMFVEYCNDLETKNQLEIGFPVVLSRLGNKMFKCGFTWFKDWYFPEGYLEGNQKLQGEKPLNGDARNRHLQMITDEIVGFTQRPVLPNANHEYNRRALARTSEILSILEDSI
jgi:hypothetical protein